MTLDGRSAIAASLDRRRGASARRGDALDRARSRGANAARHRPPPRSDGQPADVAGVRACPLRARRERADPAAAASRSCRRDDGRARAARGPTSCARTASASSRPPPRSANEIVLVGHSLGGALACISRTATRESFARSPIAPFLGHQAASARLACVRAASARAHAERFLWWDPIDRGRSAPKHGYPRYTTRALRGRARARRRAARRRAWRAAARRARRDRAQRRRDVGEQWRDRRSHRALARRRRRRTSHVHRLVGLGPSHDIVEPERHARPAARFLPHLHALLDAIPRTTTLATRSLRCERVDRDVEVDDVADDGFRVGHAVIGAPEAAHRFVVHAALTVAFALLVVARPRGSSSRARRAA